MKHLLTILGIASTFLIMQPQRALAQRGGGNPPPQGPVYGGLVNIPYSSPTPSSVGSYQLIENEGPALTSSFLDLGVSLGEYEQINIKDLEPTFLGGGKYNDRASSVLFSGDVVGKYTFYDSPDGNRDDDYCVVTFLQSPPSGQSYYLWTLEQSYSDQYVMVEYHSVGNDLNGKVSSVFVAKY